MDARIAVVGAGYAGMAAAVAAAQAGASVVVFEAGAVPGGRARRVEARGRTFDNGQHILIGAYSELLRLMRAVAPERPSPLLRLGMELRYAEGFSLRPRFFPGEAGLLAGLLLANGATLGERLSAVRFMAKLRADGFVLAEDCTVASLLGRHGQQGAMTRFVWEPLCVSALNTPAALASARAFLAVLRDALCGPAGASDLLLPACDLSALFPEPAADYVRRQGGEVRLRTRVTGLDALKREFQAVILAVAPQHLGALLPQAASFAEAFSYQPIFTCYLQYPDAFRLPVPMLGFASGLVQWAFDRGALLGEPGRVACVISAQGEHQQMAQKALAEGCHQALARAFPGLPAPAWSQVIGEKRATVACVPGVPRPGARTADPGVFLAGDYTDPEYPPTLEAAVRSGVRAAGLALERAG